MFFRFSASSPVAVLIHGNPFEVKVSNLAKNGNEEPLLQYTNVLGQDYLAHNRLALTIDFHHDGVVSLRSRSKVILVKNPENKCRPFSRSLTIQELKAEFGESCEITYTDCCGRVIHLQKEKDLDVVRHQLDCIDIANPQE